MLSLIGSTAEDNGLFTDWLHIKTTWTSPTVHEEMIQLMENTVISEGKCFFNAVMADETAKCMRKNSWG